jgi:TIR domain
MEQLSYKVFVSHGTDDRWVAGRIAAEIRDRGARTFLDETDIPKGADFKRIIHGEIASSNELIALFTPWSAKRAWVWIEMGAAWGQGKPVVAVFYGMKASDLEASGQGKAILEDFNVLELNAIGAYFDELGKRIGGSNNA